MWRIVVISQAFEASRSARLAWPDERANAVAWVAVGSLFGRHRGVYAKTSHVLSPAAAPWHSMRRVEMSSNVSKGRIHQWGAEETWRLETRDHFFQTAATVWYVPKHITPQISSQAPGYSAWRS